jgi:HlyD family secretion protein
MDPKLFRKASIDRLSSPEELDQVIKVSSSRSWAALTAVLLLCGAVSVWAVAGRVPTTAIGQGMIVRPGGVINVVARSSGTVRSIDVTAGQRVDANQVVATIAQPALLERLRGLNGAVAELRAKRERDLKRKSEEVAIRVEAIAGQRENTRRSIGELQQQRALAADQIPIMEQLFARGLVTNQQVIAARQRVVEIEGEIASRRAQLTQLDAQESEVRAAVAALDSDLQFQLASEERNVAAVTSELALLEAVATPYAGRILEIKVSAGAAVTTDAPIVSIQPDAEGLEAIIYVSALQAKDIRAGMAAEVSPSTVKREEYGFIRGQVAFVADYPATLAALMRNFQNEQLVNAVAGRGPVTEVRVTLEADPATSSGFRWSSPGGPPVTMSAGTLATTEIVTARRAPITFAVPLLRQKLGVR